MFATFSGITSIYSNLEARPSRGETMMVSSTQLGSQQDTARSKRRLDLITGRPDGFTSTSSTSDTRRFQGKRQWTRRLNSTGRDEQSILILYDPDPGERVASWAYLLSASESKIFFDFRE